MCIPHFVNSASQQVLKAAARACQIFKFKPQDPILYEGVENYSIFWILKGSCRAVKLVPFLKRYQTAVPLPPPSNMDDGMKLKKSLSRRYKLAEYEPGVTLLRQSDKVVTQLLTIDELGLGDMFPDMVGVTSQLNGDDLITRLSDTSATRLDSRSYVSIIASSDVEIIGLTRVDYASIATDAMLKESFEATSRLRVPLTVLQQSVLSSAET
ncbi:hypothetical protein BC830DRAFT_93956 [Chytriomyces sp. MP71]|nr:hypothetical protein BC830DRAFT_93956 [Chytriomyces sp. MP71]